EDFSGVSWYPVTVEHPRWLGEIKHFREVPSNFSNRRHSGCQGLTLPHSQTFVVKEKEGAITSVIEMRNHDGPVQSRANLVLVVSRPDAVKVVPPIQLSIA